MATWHNPNTGPKLKTSHRRYYIPCRTPHVPRVHTIIMNTVSPYNARPAKGLRHCYHGSNSTSIIIPALLPHVPATRLHIRLPSQLKHNKHLTSKGAINNQHVQPATSKDEIK